MKIIRCIILSILLTSSFAGTVFINNNSACTLVRVGQGALPEVRHHTAPDTILPHSQARIEVSMKPISGDILGFFDIYSLTCADHEAMLFINGDHLMWFADLDINDKVSLYLPGGNYAEEEIEGAYSEKLVLVDSHQ